MSDQPGDESPPPPLPDSSSSSMSLTSDEVNYLIFRWVQHAERSISACIEDIYWLKKLFLLHRYLQESGFVHSAFSFAHESMLSRTGLRAVDRSLPPGALITFLQKGLQYVGIEETLQQEDRKGGAAALDGATSEPDFTLLSPATLTALARPNPPIRLNVPPATAVAAIKARLEEEAKLQQPEAFVLANQAVASARIGAASAALLAAAEQKLAAQQLLQAETDAMQGNATIGNKRALAVAKRGPKKQKKGKEQAADVLAMRRTSLDSSARSEEDSGVASNNGSRPMEVDETDSQQQQRHHEQHPAHKGHEARPLTSNNSIMARMNGDKDHNHIHGNGDDGLGHPPAAIMTGPVEAEPDDIGTASRNDEILLLQMHESEVFMCAWNPVYTTFIATGSGDASARIWEMTGANAMAGLKTVKLLPHGSDTRDKKNKDVTTLEWSSNGQYLATGSYDGIARVWSRSGELLYTLRKHTGPIFSLKWNKGGNYLLSGSYDTTAIVWDVSEPKADPVIQQFTEHEAPTLDVDWKDQTTFATCSTDKTVHIYQVGGARPLKIYRGHTDEVNAVKWDPSGAYLASCSDDCTAKVWEVNSDRTEPLYDFTSHQQEIYTVKWSPTGPGSQNPSKRPLLATASFDGTVRLWNITDGSCFAVFSRHRDSVYSVAFAPSGDYLASGSLAGQMYIWDIEKGEPVKSFKGKGDIFEVAWNKEETRVAACFSSNVVAVIDFDRSSLIP